MDLLSAAQKAAITAAFDDLHDTFKKTVYLFTKVVPQHTTISDNHNYLFNQTKPVVPSEPSYTKTSITARVKHMDRSEIAKIPGTQAQTNIQLPEGLIRLKVQDDDYAAIRKAAKIDFEGLTYTLFSDAGKIGPFKTNYYTLYFKRADA